MNKKYVLLIIVALVLSACNPSKKNNINQIEKAKESVRNILTDGVSARFKNVKIHENRGICGKVNAKNLYGGYVGWKRFYVTLSDNKASIEPLNDPNELWELVWKLHCKKL